MVLEGHGEGVEEVEEGEACFAEPDSMGYIDEKLQHILGHFQKEFEGAMTVENLGAKMGEYGSFLPAYQRALPNLTQPRSPQKTQIQNTLRYQHLPSEGVQNTSSISGKSATSAMPGEHLGKKEMFTNTANNAESLSQQSSLNKSGNVADQKTLKVRIKVGPDSALTRNNADIYSGLGLDISPSSSFDDSPEGSGGNSPELEDIAVESPKTIIQIMTCICIPGGLLLSPLHENLFQLTEKDSSFFRKGKLAMPYTDMPERHLTVVEPSSFATEMKGYREKGLKSREKIRKPTKLNSSEDKTDLGTSLSKDICTEAPTQNEHIPSTVGISMPPANSVDKKLETQTEHKRGSTEKRGHPKEPRKVIPKNTIALPESIMKNGDGIFDSEIMQHRGNLNLSSMVDKMSNPNGNSFDQQIEGWCKAEKDLEPAAEHVDHVKQFSSRKATSHEPYRDELLQENDLVSDKKVKLESQTQSESFRDSKDNLSSNSSAAGKEQRRRSHATTDRAEKKPKVPKSRKDTRGDVIVEESQNGVSSLDLYSKPKHKVVKSEFEKDSSISNQIFKEKPDGKKVRSKSISEASVSEPMASPLKGNASTYPIVVPQNPIVIEESWVACDKCHKWRLLPHGTNPDYLPKKWHCSQLNWLPGMNKCDISEDQTTDALRALYQVPAREIAGGLDSQNNVSNSGNNITSVMYPIRNVDRSSQTVLPGVKKKNKDVPSHSTLSPFPSSKKKNEQSKNITSDDVTQYPFESNSLKKVGSANSSKSSDLGREKKRAKHKEKHKNLVCQSNGGEFWGESDKHLTEKNKREVVPDGFRASKKPKKGSSLNGLNDFPSDNDISASGGLSVKLTGNNQQKYSEFSLSKKSKSDRKGSTSSYKNLKDGDQVPSNGEIKKYFSASDVEKSGNKVLSAKKRKIKDRQESRHTQDVATAQNVEDGLVTKGVPNETDPQGKRAKVLKSEGKEPRARLDGKLGKKVTKTSFSQNKVHPQDAMAREDHFGAGEGHQLSQFEENATFNRHSESISFKRDTSCPQASTAAHSSSSKVSGSRKRKDNIPESKGSPVESVSSSPLRVPGIEKFSRRKTSVPNNDAINVALPLSGTPKKFVDSDVDVASDSFKKSSKEAAFSSQQKYLEGHSIRQSEMQGTLDFHEKEINQLSGGKSEESIDVKRDGVDVSEPVNLEDINVVTDASTLEGQHCKFHSKHSGPYDYPDTDKLSRQHNNSSSQYKQGKSSNLNERHRGSKSDVDYGQLEVSASYIENKDLNSVRHSINCQKEHDSAALENLDNCGPSTLSHRDSISGVAALHKSSRPTVQEKAQAVPPNPVKNEASHLRSEKNDRTELGTRTVRTNLNTTYDDKRERQTRVHNSASSPPKGNRSEVYDVDARHGVAPKVVKQSRHIVQNGSHHNVVRHAISNGPDVASPSKKDAVAVYRLRKEATDLKHSANRMKSLGQELESTGVYFAAALKFLHAAFLMETDSLKQGEATQFYHDTAKLCDFVAREYEKLKEMAAAALAYKCVEVAFLKSAFHKNPHASKDRSELLAALQMLPPGESPSSSASDVDSLNNQATLGKVTTAKGVGSPQIAGNHVIASRHHSQVMKLLQYTSDLNCAFEATRKSQIAIAAASASLGKDQVDTLSSVTTVLNFNFHNVEELLRLVRLAQQSIGR